MASVAHCAPARVVVIEVDGATVQLCASAGRVQLAVVAAAGGEAVMCDVEPPLNAQTCLFGNVSANATHSMLLVWTPCSVAMVDINTLAAARSRVAAGSCASRTLLEDDDLRADDDVVVRARWHPLANGHVVVLTRRRLFVFDTADGSRVPCNDLVLPRHSVSGGLPERAAAAPFPASFQFGAARGWELLSLTMVYQDGTLYTLCPFLPAGALLPAADWALLRADACTASELAGGGTPGAGLALEWLEGCWTEVEDCRDREGGGGHVVRYTPTDSHPLFSAVAGEARPRFAPGLQGPLRCVPHANAPPTPAVDVHVHPASDLALISVLHGDGSIVTVHATCAVVPAWVQRDAALAPARPHDSSDALSVYLRQQVVLEPLPTGLMLGGGGGVGGTRRGGGTTAVAAGAAVIVDALQVEIAGAAGGDPLAAARASVASGRGTVPGGAGSDGVAALHRPGEGTTQRNVDVIAAPYFLTPGLAVLPSLLLVVSRHAVYGFLRPSPISYVNLDDLEGGTGAGLAGRFEGRVTVLELCGRAGEDICGAATRGGRLVLWGTLPGQAVCTAAGAVRSAPGELRTVSLTDAKVLAASGAEVALRMRGGRGGDGRGGAFAELRPFREDASRAIADVDSAWTAIDSACTVDAGGDDASVGVSLLARVASASTALGDGCATLRRLHRLTAARHRVLLQVVDSLLGLAGEGGAGAGRETAAASAAAIDARRAASLALGERAERVLARMASLAAADAAPAGSKELAAVLEQLSVGCATSLARLQGSLRGLHGRADAAAQCTLAQARVRAGLEEVALGLRASLARVAEEQVDLGRAVRAGAEQAGASGVPSAKAAPTPSRALRSGLA